MSKERQREKEKERDRDINREREKNIYVEIGSKKENIKNNDKK